MAISSLGIGIVGCGRAAQRLHLPALSAIAGLEVRALCDRDPGQLAVASQRVPSARAYDRSARLLDDPSIDIVAICLPAVDHADAAIAALAAGKHVLVEKPLAATVADADRMVACAGASGSIATIGFNLRAHRLVQQARQIVRSGRLGSIEAIRSVWTTTLPESDFAAWRHRRSTGGGSVLEIAPHHVDLWRFLTGADVARLTVDVRSDISEDDTAAVSGRLTNGTLVSGVFSQRSSAVNEIEMYGRSHRVRFSLYEGNSLQMTPASSTPVDWKARVQRMGVAIASAPGSLARTRRGGDFLESYRNQWIALRASVCDGAAPLSSWEDGRRCLRALCEAVTPVHAHD